MVTPERHLWLDSVLLCRLSFFFASFLLFLECLLFAGCFRRRPRLYFSSDSLSDSGDEEEEKEESEELREESAEWGCLFLLQLSTASRRQDKIIFHLFYTHRRTHIYMYGLISDVTEKTDINKNIWFKTLCRNHTTCPTKQELWSSSLLTLWRDSRWTAQNSTEAVELTVIG